MFPYDWTKVAMKNAHPNAGSFQQRHASMALLVVPLALLYVRNATAMPAFPDEIKAHLGLNYTPPCTLCHATSLGGGPMTTKFGQAMVAVGLTLSIPSLDKSLDALAANNTDSNHDGIPDIVQLQQGGDPNTGGAQLNVPEEKYGCGARVARGPIDSKGIGTLIVTVAGMMLLGRRRRNRKVKSRIDPSRNNSREDKCPKDPSAR